MMRLASLLVPTAVRPRWREEWAAELAEIRTRRGRLAAARMLLGAFADARTVRKLHAGQSAGASRHPFRGLRDDLRYTTRSMAAAPAFAVCVTASLGLGVAAMVTTFTFVNGMLFRPIPGVANQDRLVRITLSYREGNRTESATTHDNYLALREGMTTLEGLAAHSVNTIAVTMDGRADVVRASAATGNYFEVLGVRPALGRLFDGSVDAGGEASSVVVIAHSLWTRRFANRPDILGTFVKLGAFGSARVIGVAPPRFVGAEESDLGIFDRSVELWLPIPLAREVFPPGPGFFYRFYGRLAEGRTRQDADSEAAVVGRRIAQTRPAERQDVRVRVAGVWLIEDPEGQAGLVAALLSVPALVLIIGCVNAANMLMARGSRRAREIAVRLALGASRWRVVRPLLIESLLLALLAAAASLPIAHWAISLVTAIVNVPMPVEGRVVIFAAVVACLSAGAFSLAPAFTLSGARPATVLGSSRTGDGPRRSRARRLLVVSQVALSAALLGVGSQLVMFLAAQAPSAGTAPDKLIMTAFDLRQFRMAPAAVDAFYGDLLRRVAASPDADGVALARRSAVWTFGRGFGGSAMAVRRPDTAPADEIVATGGYTAGDLFGALGLPVLKGRRLTPEDETPAATVAVVNQRLADLLFEGDALGRIIAVGHRPAPAGTPAIEVTIVGVVENAHEPSDYRDPIPAVYLPVRLEPEPRLTLYARASGSTQALAAQIREAAAAIDDRIPPIEMRTLEETSDLRQAPERIAAQGVSLLGLIGLLLAAGGVYGVMSYLVSLRTQEIGIRLALGADARAMMRMTLTEAAKLSAWGAAIGGAGAFIASKIVQSQLHGVDGLHLPMFAASFALLAGAMLIASAVPARRAARVDPIEALRQE